MRLVHLHLSVAKLNSIDQLVWFSCIDFESWTDVKEITHVLDDRMASVEVMDILYKKQPGILHVIRHLFLFGFYIIRIW